MSSVCASAQDVSFNEFPVGDTSLYYSYAEQMPRYNHRDGEKELIKQLSSSLDFSSCSSQGLPSGKIILMFVVDIDGKVINPQVVKGECDAANKLLMQKLLTLSFIPGMQNQKRVRVKYTVPIIVEFR